jgi:SAM-dependent methyltransferase
MIKSYIPADSPFLTRDPRKDRWAIPYHFDCLNARIEVLLADNADAVRGRRILDLGSHIGTFAYAALTLGAREVMGVDAETRAVDTCRGLFREHQVPAASAHFLAADVFDFLEGIAENSFDTVFCFGLLYYTAEPYRLLKLMARAARCTVILDTFTAAFAALAGKDASAVQEKLGDEALTLPLQIVSLTQPEKVDYRLPKTFTRRGRELSLMTLPTGSLLDIWFESLALRARRLDWSAHITRAVSHHDLMTPEHKKASHWADVYASGVRAAYRLDVKTAGSAGSG